MYKLIPRQYDHLPYAHIYHLLCLNAHFPPSNVNRPRLGTSTIVPDLTYPSQVDKSGLWLLPNACGGLDI
jgi:hypothetical protein